MMMILAVGALVAGVILVMMFKPKEGCHSTIYTGQTDAAWWDRNDARMTWNVSPGNPQAQTANVRASCSSYDWCRGYLVTDEGLVNLTDHPPTNNPPVQGGRNWYSSAVRDCST